MREALPTIEDVQQKAKEGEFEDSAAVLRWFENLNPEDRKMVALAMDFAFDEGYDDAVEDWGRP